MRWQKVIPAYLEWANAREQLGWQFVFGEQAFSRELALDQDQGTITLHGRIDRIDQNTDGERAVLDYKTNNVAALKGKLKDGEDHQLPFYGLLSDVPVAAANYVALELTRDKARDKTGDVEAPHYADWQGALQRQIAGTMSAVRQGAALPANGVESVCQYCDVRGLCRKGAW
ncbi:RecB family exonuclease [Undibacterium arcticum]